jgi:hypothetical protein
MIANNGASGEKEAVRKGGFLPFMCPLLVQLNEIRFM